MTELAAALADVLAGRLAGWAGLPSGTPVAGLLTALAATEVDAAGPTEHGISRYDLYRVLRADPPGRVDVWSLAGVGVLVEYADPPGVDPDPQAAELGAPELALTGHRVAAGGEVHELVYAGRGLTLSLVQADESWLRAVHVQLYVPGPVSHWLTRISAGSRPHAAARPAVPRLAQG
ncbi:MAG: hypothetical protein V7637_597 [Mycobacteriales bacterium]